MRIVFDRLKKRTWIILFSIIVFSFCLIIIFFRSSFSVNYRKLSNESDFSIETQINLLLKLADSLKLYDDSEAMRYAIKAEKLVEKTDEAFLFPKIYIIQGGIYSHQLDYPKALAKLLAAKSIYEENEVYMDGKAQFNLEYASCLNNISEVYFRLHRMEEAFEFITSSLHIYEKMNDDSLIAKATRNLGAIYFNQGKYEEALESYLKVLEYKNSTGDRTELGLLYSNIGATKLILNRPEASIGFFVLAEKEILNALELDPHNITLTKTLSEVYYNKACYFHEISEESLYQEYLHLSLDVLDGHYFPIESESKVLNLHLLYHKRGEYKKAYTYLLMHQQIRDSLFKIENSKQISNLEKEHHFYKKQKIFELDKKESEQKFLRILIVMLFLIVVILYFLNRQKEKIIQAELERKKMEESKTLLVSQINVTNKILTKKEKELKNMISKIADKNQSIHTLESYLDQINTSHQNHIHHQKMNDLLKKNSKEAKDLEDDKQELLLSIEQLSVAMFVKLDCDFGGLTQRQKHLAALVKYDFSAKEISILFNISHKAVQVAKYRLKKRLGLSPEEELEDFLRNY